MTSKLPNAAVFAFNTSFKSMEVFDTRDAAIARVPGLEIAEGDWIFFAADGSPLEAVFSVNPVVQDGGRWVFSNGVYDLQPGDGPTFLAVLYAMCRETDGVWMWTFEALEAYFRDP